MDGREQYRSTARWTQVPINRIIGRAVKKAVVHSGGNPARELVRSTR